ncbi:MAG: IS256 family transposase [Candidatus Saccharimonadales bacterium]
MTKPKNKPTNNTKESHRYDELAAALVATPQVQTALRSVTSYDDLVGGEGLIARMLKPLIQELLDAEMTEHLGYPKHDASGYLTGNSRNGSYERTMRGSDGTLSLNIPRDRNGDFSSTVVQPYKQVSTELEQKITSLYAFGTSTADIVDFLEDTYDVQVSTGFISQVTEKVLELAREWQARPLQAVYTIAYLDAIHIKCREQNKVINKAVHIVMAYDQEGKKEILGHYISSGGEGAKFWLSVITDLKNRGVSDILIACVDGLSGFESAIHSIFPQTTVQRCIVHAIRNSMAYIPHKLKSEFMEYLRPVYTAVTKDEAEANLALLEERWNEKYPMAVNIWRNNWEALSHYFAFSPDIRRMMYTTNPIESYNSVLRKYTKNKRSFVSNEALQKVLYLATQKAEEHWDKCVPNWPTILNQFAIHFEGRISMK